MKGLNLFITSSLFIISIISGEEITEDQRKWQKIILIFTFFLV